MYVWVCNAIEWESKSRKRKKVGLSLKAVMVRLEILRERPWLGASRGGGTHQVPKSKSYTIFLSLLKQLICSLQTQTRELTSLPTPTWHNTPPQLIKTSNWSPSLSNLLIYIFLLLFHSFEFWPSVFIPFSSKLYPFLCIFAPTR